MRNNQRKGELTFMQKQEAAVEELAKVLHAEFRATFKSLEQNVGLRDTMMHISFRHDHGWKACHKKNYFRRRAQRIHKAANRTVIANLFLVPERLLGPIK